MVKGLDAAAARDHNDFMVAFVPFPNDQCSRTNPRVLKAVVDRRLSALVPTSDGAGNLAAAVRYSLLAPGKRIRPVLTVLAAWEFGDQDLVALDAGCAIEMVHAASLILDDMPAMDDAAERRGQPATHVRFGEDVAMLSAITLLSHAYATVGAMQGVDPDVRCALIAILARAVGMHGLAGGQYADLRPGTVPSSGGIAEANHLKTGVLFVAAVEMAAAIRRLDDRKRDTLRTCASELGQAFQILDDLIDGSVVLADGRSEDAGKATLLALLGQDEAKVRLRRHVEGALRGLQPEGAFASFVRSIFAGGLLTRETV